MRFWLQRIAIAFALLWPGFAHAQGTVPLALVQQFGPNGVPLASCLLYTYQAGTVATPLNSYQDYGLTILNPNPLQCDQYGRVPMFWLPNGLVHLRLTDSNGLVYLDTTMQVLGPSSGGGGGSTVDPTTIASTGDVKFRLTSETLSGWVTLNGLTIGSATSGATGRANADTQNLFVYLWQNCAQPTSNNHCAVAGGLGSSALADFNANKQLALPDMRDRGPAGRDCMGATCAGGLLLSNITSGGSDGVDSPFAFGGAANPQIAQANLPNVNFNVTIPAGQGAHTHTLNSGGSPAGAMRYATNSESNPGGGSTSGPFPSPALTATDSATLPQLTGTAASGGAGTQFAVMDPFALGTWYMKL